MQTAPLAVKQMPDILAARLGVGGSGGAGRRLPAGRRRSQALTRCFTLPNKGTEICGRVRLGGLRHEVRGEKPLAAVRGAIRGGGNQRGSSDGELSARTRQRLVAPPRAKGGEARVGRACGAGRGRCRAAVCAVCRPVSGAVGHARNIIGRRKKRI